VFEGSYRDWERRQREEAAGASRPQPKRVAKPQAAAAVTKPVGSVTKEKPTGIAALSMEKLESQIQKLQSSMQAIDMQLTEPAVYADGARMRRLQGDRAHIERELEPLEQEWARRADQA
jgi:hypothetical protein